MRDKQTDKQKRRKRSSKTFFIKGIISIRSWQLTEENSLFRGKRVQGKRYWQNTLKWNRISKANIVRY